MPATEIGDLSGRVDALGKNAGVTKFGVAAFSEGRRQEVAALSRPAHVSVKKSMLRPTDRVVAG